jgi:hypothetical protein
MYSAPHKSHWRGSCPELSVNKYSTVEHAIELWTVSMEWRKNYIPTCKACGTFVTFGFKIANVSCKFCCIVIIFLHTPIKLVTYDIRSSHTTTIILIPSRSSFITQQFRCFPCVAQVLRDCRSSVREGWLHRLFSILYMTCGSFIRCLSLSCVFPLYLQKAASLSYTTYPSTYL